MIIKNILPSVALLSGALFACQSIAGESSVTAQHITSVDSLRTVLRAGNDVNAVLDLSQCQADKVGKSEIKKPNVKMDGGLKVSPFLIRDGMIAFSDNHQTVYTRGGGTPKAINQTLRYEVEPNGKVTMTSFIFSLPDYKLMREASYHCEFDKGLSFYRVK